MPKTHKRLIQVILFFFIFVSCLAVNYAVLKKSKIIRSGDGAIQIQQSLSMYRLLYETPQVKFPDKIASIFTLKDQCHPPLYSFIGALSYRVISLLSRAFTVDTLVMTMNAVFLFFGLAAIYGISARLCRSVQAGLVAVVLFSCMPAVFGQSRLAHIDFPLMCAIPGAMYLLLKTNGLTSLFYSVAAGVVFGLAQLTKEAAVVFFIVPVLYYFVKSFKSGDRKRVSRNFFFTSAAFIVTAGSVYLRPVNWHVFPFYLLRTHFVKTEVDFLYYIKKLPDAVGPLLLVCFIPFLISHMVNFKKRDKLAFLWLVVPFFLFSLSPSKSLRLILPVFPVFAVIMTQELYLDGFLKKTREWCVFLLVLAAILQYIFFNCGILRVQAPNGTDYNAYGLISSTRDSNSAAASALLRVFEGEAKGCRSKEILFMFDIPAFPWVLKMRFLCARMPFRVCSFLEGDETSRQKYFPQEWKKVFARADYIVDKTGLETPGHPLESFKLPALLGLREEFAHHRDGFDMIADIPLNGEHHMYVYRRKAVF